MWSKRNFWMLVLGMACMLGCSDDVSEGVGLDTTQTVSYSVINGSADTKALHRGVVSIVVDKTSSGVLMFYSTCTGTLIHPQWVLTAAHCVTEDSANGVDPGVAKANNPYLKVAIGNDIDELKDLKNGYEIEEIITHEEYRGWSKGKDIALIKLKKPLSDSYVRPIEPLRLDNGYVSLDDGMNLGQNIEFVGFGVTEKGGKGGKVRVSGMLDGYCGKNNPSDAVGKNCNFGKISVTGCHPDTSKCKSKTEPYCETGKYCFTDKSTTVVIPYGTVLDLHGASDGGTCSGDSGGPVLEVIDGTEYVTGITSYGDAVCSAFNVYTAVQDYYDWIVWEAPEVQAYYEQRKAGMASEKSSGACGSEHVKYCQARYGEDYTACYFSEDWSLNCAMPCKKEGKKTKMCGTTDEGVGIRTSYVCQNVTNGGVSSKMYIAGEVESCPKKCSAGVISTCK